MAGVLAKAGAVAFGLWGLLHLAGSGLILFALATGGTNEGYSIYGYSGDALPEISGAVLAYFSYMIGLVGLCALFISVRFNWTNSKSGLAANTIVCGLTEVGLVLFMVVPGFVGLSEALPGLLLLAVGVVVGGIACQRGHPEGKR